MGCLSSGLESPMNGGIQPIGALECEPIARDRFKRLACSFELHTGHLVDPVERVTAICFWLLNVFDFNDIGPNLRQIVRVCKEIEHFVNGCINLYIACDHFHGELLLIFENGSVLNLNSGGTMGALSRFNARSWAVQLISTRGPPPFFDSFA